MHPADLGVAGDDWRIVSDEQKAYTSAWRLGENSSRAPNPIPIPYVVNAAYLSHNGEAYHYDPFRLPPWDIGITLPVRSNAVVSSFKPRYYTPDIPVTMTTLAVTPGIDTRAYAVEETPPEGWAITDISHSGIFDVQSNKIRWGLFSDDAVRDLTYRVTPSESAVDAQSFVGQAAFDEADEPISGQRTMLPSPCTGNTLHIHDMTLSSDDDISCTITSSIIVEANVDLQSGSSLELQAGTGVTLLPHVSVRTGGILLFCP